MYFQQCGKNYITRERDAFRVEVNDEYPRAHLEGRRFPLHTDRSALKESSTSKRREGRSVRWITIRRALFRLLKDGSLDSSGRDGIYRTPMNMRADIEDCVTSYDPSVVPKKRVEIPTRSLPTIVLSAERSSSSFTGRREIQHSDDATVRPRGEAFGETGST